MFCLSRSSDSAIELLSRSDSVKVVTSQHDEGKRVAEIVKDYQGGKVSKQVVRIVLSYVDYINRTVWSKV